MNNSKPTIGILGAGKLGTTLGRLLLKANYPVLISSSKTKENISLIIDVLVPGAIPMDNEELTKKADIILLALPLGKYKSIPTNHLNNKLVIDAMNYWWEVDGLERIPSDPNLTSSEMIQDYLKHSIVIKAFNHMGYHDLEAESFSEDRKVIAYAGDDEPSKHIIKQIILDTGFKPLDLGQLKKGSILEPGSSLFGANLNEEEFKKHIM